MALKKEIKDSYRLGTQAEAYQLRISDHVLDNIYGHIGITEVEKQIERLAIFKRLHSVSQLGLVNWIFPCALHTRYIHSIGVMHVAGQMAQHINQNVWEELGGQNFFDDCDIQMVRLAGLLHDIGHYPMSHNVEQAYKDAKKKIEYEQKEISQHLKYYVNCPDYLHPKWHAPKSKRAPDNTSFNDEYSGSHWPHHESAGQKIIFHNEDIANVVKWYFVLLPSEDEKEWVVNPKFCQNRKPGSMVTNSEVNQIVHTLMTVIGNMIIGNYGMVAGEKWMDKYSAMIQLIHSDLDADNLDYLLRDATFSGTSYGVMDMGILLNSLTVSTLKWKSDFGEETRYLVGVKRKGIGCVEQFLMNKFLAYTQMIFNKYTSILEAMLLRVMKDRISGQTDTYSVDGLENILEQKKTNVDYLKFSDHYIFEKLFDMAQNVGNMASLPYAIVTRLIHSCAFDLENGENECICAGIDQESIRSEMKNHEVYKAFCEMCKKVGKLKGKDLWNGKNSIPEQELFSFRFEEYSLTKQIPLEAFVSQIDDKQYDETRADRHFYRLATGIPVLENNAQYKYSGKKQLGDCEKELPPLCVDCSQSVLHQIYGMRYVSLRKYRIEEY